ncbi:MAG: hypothetical protein NPIRA06_04570 [Nitrospirales bacterium]|nr:MAG: hypothetical protein NPIRA06_04570 [Nitrospirales bacterium]
MAPEQMSCRHRPVLFWTSFYRERDLSGAFDGIGFCPFHMRDIPPNIPKPLMQIAKMISMAPLNIPCLPYYKAKNVPK